MNICIFKVVAVACSLTVALPLSSYALAVVESRTGEPVVRESIQQEPIFNGTVIHDNASQNISNTSSKLSNNSNSNHHGSSSSHNQAMNVNRSGSIDGRSARLTLSQIEALQKEVTELRGLVEVQEHEINQLKKSQQSLFADLERRINEIPGTAVANANNKSSAKFTASAGNSKNSNSGNSANKITSANASKATSLGSNTSAKTASNSSNKNKNLVENEPENQDIDSLNEVIEDANASLLHIPAETSKITKTSSATSNDKNKTKSATNAGSKTEDADAKAKSNAVGTTTGAKADTSKAAANAVLMENVGIVASHSSQSTPKSNNALNEKDTYQAAYNLVRNKRYPEAITALQDYLKRFPTGEQAANAHYWLGEVYLVQWQADKTKEENLEKANREFNNVTAQFPSHIKACDSTLKLGLIQLDKGNMEVARQYLTDVKARFPGTAAARVAETRLQQLNTE